MSNPSHPIHPVTTYKADGDDVVSQTYTGLTKREYFAGLAMQAMISTVNKPDMDSVLEIPKNTAQWAVKFADELLKQLQNTNPQKP